MRTAFACLAAALALAGPLDSAKAQGGAGVIDNYRRAYMDECTSADTEAHCSCMLAGVAVEALGLKNGPYATLAILPTDAIEALMLDVDREISSRIHNRVPITGTQSRDVMAYALAKHGIGADVDTMVQLTTDAFGRTALTCNQ